ncbi:hypothetical protein HUJ04_012827 [Dendroctonus ponderosae]|nr:hypothetical protein HUJ04_012827 [Dendroctonus ponderosae]KAH1030111.1 hypothetical protein HUJ05_003233 [Dendroctonus ponderosae]
MQNELPVDTEFPVWGLLPKRETGVVSFLSKYPSYDGKGIIIAILDSGVDPGAPGLQETSDGKPKIIERFDCSGCGDVNTSTLVSAEDGYITGLTGRKMKIPSNWNNPSETYRIGVKNAFDLYPDRLKERVKSEYKKKKWEEGQRKLISDLNRDLSNLETSQNSNSSNENEKHEKEDCEAKLDVLNNLDKKYYDSGPVYDCILFNDGSKWMCCINTSADNELANCPVLGEYSVTHEYLPLTKLDSLNFSFNVHDNGNVLELVGVCSSHGTHVASIASAYFANAPEQNGIAPGAQVISLTIGDGRLGSMETGTGLIRAMIKILELKQKMDVHVINMSYGEHAHWVDAGRIGDLVNEIVNKYGIIWVSSAGNNGPALGTISTPSDIDDEPIISVGAYVSPEMMVAEYAMKQKLSGAPYTWSSRGPTVEGGVGVHICAPGGAITSVPNFTLRYSQLMNGTSMASPSCAGAICLLLSGIIQENCYYSPYLVRRALMNTANFIAGVEIPAQGAGLIQVDKAFDYLIAYQSIRERNVRFQLQCGSSSTKGIYLRTKTNSKKHIFKVSVEPRFLNEDEVSAEEKINFNMKLALTCPLECVQYPKHLDLSNVARTFGIDIDTSALPEGLHSTFVSAYDTACVSKGPVFQIPVTIIQPSEVPDQKFILKYSSIPFKPNTIKRHYFVVPSAATWAVLKLTSNEDSGRFVIHTMQSLPRQHCKSLETVKIVAVTSKTDTYVSFQVKGDIVLEVVIAKYWANTGEATLEYSIAFYGVKPNQPLINMHSADGIHTVEVKTLQGEEISPTISLKNSVQILKPSEGKITPLTDRDVIPPNRQIYELVLVYNFSISKPCEVSPNLSLLSHMLYESEYESQLWMLFDANKQLLSSGDAYPSKYTVKLEKGEYTIRLQVRHDKRDYLEKITDASLLLQQKLASSIVMDVYLTYSQALIGGKKAGVTYNANPHTIVPFYIAPLASDKFSIKSNNMAHYLSGTITYAKDEIDNSSPKKTGSNGGGAPVLDKSKKDEYNDALRDLSINWISKLDKEGGEKLYCELLKNHPNNLPIHSSYLQMLDPLDKRILPALRKKPSVTADDLNKIANTCDKVLNSLNEETILASMAVKTDLRVDAVKVKIQAEQQKNIYLECLARKGIALSRLSLLDESGDNQHQEIANVWKSLVKFVDPSDAKILTSHVLFFAIWHAFVNQHYGRLLKFMFKMQEDKSSEELERRIIDICQELKWKHVVEYLERGLPSKFPNSYRPF